MAKCEMRLAANVLLCGAGITELMQVGVPVPSE